MPQSCTACTCKHLQSFTICNSPTLKQRYRASLITYQTNLAIHNLTSAKNKPNGTPPVFNYSALKFCTEFHSSIIMHTVTFWKSLIRGCFETIPSDRAQHFSMRMNQQTLATNQWRKCRLLLQFHLQTDWSGPPKH